MTLVKNLTKNENKIIIFLISILPISLISGSAISNSIVLLIDIYFIFEIYKKKQFNFLANKVFFIFIFIWILLLLNSIFIANSQESFIRSFGFLRFTLLIFAFKYFFEKKDGFSKKIVLGTWFVTFNIVTVDIFIEFFTGTNILGIKSAYNGRIASFTGDELKIGNYYFGFILLTLSFYYKNYYKNFKLLFYILILIFMVTSFLIGERSNFIKIFFVCLIFIFLINNQNFFRKILIIASFLLITLITTLNNDFYKSRIISEIMIPIKEKGISNFISESRYGKHYGLAKKIFKENIIFGVGIKNYRIASKMPKYHTSKNLEGTTTHPHQIHYEFLSETGIVGYIFFIIFFSFSALFGLKSYLNNKDPFILSSTLFIVATAIPFIPSGSFFTSYGASIFWINYSFLLIKNR